MKNNHKKLGTDIDNLQKLLKDNGELFKECYHINNSFIKNRDIQNVPIQRIYFDNINKESIEKYIETLTKLKNEIDFIVDTEIHLLTIIKEDPFTRYT